MIPAHSMPDDVAAPKVFFHTLAFSTPQTISNKIP